MSSRARAMAQLAAAAIDAAADAPAASENTEDDEVGEDAHDQDTVDEPLFRTASKIVVADMKG
eukprot:2792160-Pleurochrysis_carterae.AAC.1